MGHSLIITDHPESFFSVNMPMWINIILQCAVHLGCTEPPYVEAKLCHLTVSFVIAVSVHVFENSTVFLAQSYPHFYNYI